MSRAPFYDLFRDSSETAHKLADDLRRALSEFRKDHPFATDQDVADAIRMLQLQPEEDG